MSTSEDRLFTPDTIRILGFFYYITRWTFASDKFRILGETIRHFKCSSKRIPRAIEAKPLTQACLPPGLVYQRAPPERIFTNFYEFPDYAEQWIAALMWHSPYYLEKHSRLKEARAVLEWHQAALEQEFQVVSEEIRVAWEQLDQATMGECGAALERYQVILQQSRAILKKRRALSEQHQAVLNKIALLEGLSDRLRETCEDVRAAFEQLPSVRLNPPTILLHVVGPLSMDLRLFHSGEILEGNDVYSEYSLGYTFLENLIYNTWTPWDLRSYMALVAAKIIRKGRLYPTAFTSKLSLLVKGFVKANLQLIFQYDTKELQCLALKLPAESVDLEISSTALTSQAHNDAGVMEGALMQRSLSAMINLGVVNLTSRLTRIGEQPEFFGGSAEIWKAGLTFSDAKVTMTVAVKYLRLCVTEVTKHLFREIQIWQNLEHPHILPLLGICHNNAYESVRASGGHAVDPMMSIGIVCPWMANGTLVDFLKLSQTKLENTGELHLHLLIQVCSGLIYHKRFHNASSHQLIRLAVHSKNIVHGDLHGGNVLVDSDGCACLADFGLSAVVTECRGTSKTGAGGISSPHGGALRWAAPELVVIQGVSEPHLHPSADIYSVGGLILQAYTGAVPYSYYNEPRVLGAIIVGEKPRRPTIEEASISDVLWFMIEECWRDDPLQRLMAAALASRLKAIYSALEDGQA